MQTKKIIVRNNILKELDNLNLNDKIEILANVFIYLGTQLISDDLKDPKRITEYILNDIEKNGQTLSNALARQGLIILTWLDKGKNDRLSRNISNL